MYMVRPARWYLHPVFIFACSIIALAVFLVLTVSLYMEITTALESLVARFHIDPGMIFPSKTGMTITALSLLIIVVLAGILLAFIYYQKTMDLFQLQHNFIYNFTHELKTPVTSLRLYLETFVRHELSSEQIAEYSSNMLNDIDRLMDNIDRILNLARIESQNFGTRMEREDLVALVEEFCEKNASLFRGCSINIKHQGTGIFVMPVNEFLFDMLLMNMVSNAIKYNDSEAPALDIVFTSHLQKKTIDFIDNGIGVPRKETKKIFRKFYQGHAHSESRKLGSGLGLHLVASIANIHGWKVAVTSKGKGKGSCFTITIPGSGLEGIRKKEVWKRLKKNVF